MTRPELPPAPYMTYHQMLEALGYLVYAEHPETTVPFDKPKFDETVDTVTEEIITNPRNQDMKAIYLGEILHRTAKMHLKSLDPHSMPHVVYENISHAAVVEPILVQSQLTRIEEFELMERNFHVRDGAIYAGIVTGIFHGKIDPALSSAQNDLDPNALLAVILGDEITTPSGSDDGQKNKRLRNGLHLT